MAHDFCLLFCDGAGDVDAAGGCVGKRMGDAAAVADDIKTGVAGFQLLVYFYFHIVELDFHTVKEGIVVGGTGCDFIQGVDHFNDTVQNALGQYQAQVTGLLPFGWGWSGGHGSGRQIAER